MDACQPPRALETARTALRPVIAADAPSIFHGYASDAEATRFMSFPRHRSLVDSEAFAQRCVSCWETGAAFPWAIMEKTTDAFVGVIELRPSPPKAELGYILSPRFWGRGYASETASAIVAWAIEQSSIFRVWATCHPENLRSARVLERAGLRLEARLANWEARPNMGEAAGDSLVYARLR